MLLFQSIGRPVFGGGVGACGCALVEPARDVAVHLFLQVAQLGQRSGKTSGDVADLFIVRLFVGEQLIDCGLTVLLSSGGRLIQQIRPTHVLHLSVGQGAASHAKGILFLFGVIQRLYQLRAQHDSVRAVGFRDDVGIAGEGQTLGGVPCVYQIDRPNGVACHHKGILLQCLHTGGKEVVGAVSVQIDRAGDHAKLRHRCVILDPALRKVVAESGRQVFLDGCGVCLHDSPAFLMVFVVIFGMVFPPKQLVVPRSFFDRVLVADRKDAGVQIIGVGLFGQIQQVDAVFDVLRSLTLLFHRLIAIIENVQPRVRVVGAVGVPAEGLEHHLVDDVPDFSVVLAHAVLVRIAEMNDQIAQRCGNGSQLKLLHLLTHLRVVGLDKVL